MFSTLSKSEAYLLLVRGRGKLRKNKESEGKEENSDDESVFDSLLKIILPSDENM
jgi:hypothetical protein